MWLQSQEDQELSSISAAGQLILKMMSEYQTVDHRNKIMGNDPDPIFVRFHTQHVVQEQTNFENSVEKVNVFPQTLDYVCALVLPQIWTEKSHDNMSCPSL